jgi:hypothetical protein
MAYSVNNAPPNAHPNWRIFDPGDSILKSVTRMAVAYELLQLLINAISEYNATNTIQLPTFELAVDGDAGSFTASGSVPFKILVDATSGEQTKKAVSYLNDNLAWVTPTTGDLAGIDNPYDALIYMCRQILRLNDAIRAGGLINSASGLVTLTTDDTAREHQFTFGVQTVAVVNADGTVGNQIQEHGLVADMQAGILV